MSPTTLSDILHYDYVSQIVLYATWSTLLVIATWPGHAGVVVEREKTSRIFDGLAVYVSPAFRKRFFAILLDCEGGIFGPFVMEILNGTARSATRRGVLDIAVRGGFEGPLDGLLQEMGYVSAGQATPDVYKDATERMDVYTKFVDGKVR